MIYLPRLCAVLAIGLAAGYAVPLRAAERPNVVWIGTEDNFPALNVVLTLRVRKTRHAERDDYGKLFLGRPLHAND